jgi:hypothetical protein
MCHDWSTVDFFEICERRANGGQYHWHNYQSGMIKRLVASRMQAKDPSLLDEDVMCDSQADSQIEQNLNTDAACAGCMEDKSKGIRYD